MSYVLHIYRMTYKTYDMQEYIFVHPEEWYSMSLILRDLFVSSFGHSEKRVVPWRLCASSHWANFCSVSNGIRFILSKTLCPQRHSKVCFEILKTFGVTPKRHCPSERKFLRSQSYRTSPASIILLFYLTWFYVIFR